MSDKEDQSKVPLIIIRLGKTERKSNVFKIQKMKIERGSNVPIITVRSRMRDRERERERETERDRER